MSERIADDRSFAARLARRYYYDRSLTAQTLVDAFSETTDPLIAELLDLALHEPARTGMLGVKYDEYVKRYWPHVATVLEELEKGDAGSVPPRGRFSKKKLFWFSVLLLFAAASAAEHIGKVAAHVRGVKLLGSTVLFLQVAGALIMTIVTVSVVFAFIRALHLYRAERRRRPARNNR